ncbi:MAG: hypothetical protein JKY04_06180 [Sneathiella sp.]|nr:hypothetical protein [Sneathiella sp.]
MQNEVETETDTTSLTHQTYTRIYQMIIEGDFVPGHKLKIDDLQKHWVLGQALFEKR